VHVLVFTFKKLLNLVLWYMFLLTSNRSDWVICIFSYLLLSRNSLWLLFLSGPHTITFWVIRPTNMLWDLFVVIRKSPAKWRGLRLASGQSTHCTKMYRLSQPEYIGYSSTIHQPRGFRRPCSRLSSLLCFDQGRLPESRIPFFRFEALYTWCVG
jgi:hypothetical protein